MKKLSHYKGQKIAIHFPTYELWLRRKEINPSDNCKDDVFETKLSFHYYPFEDDFGGRYSDEDLAIEDGYTILPATDFLEEEFVYGQEYEFSNDKDFKYPQKRIFLCKTPKGKFVGYNKDSENAVAWTYCRKINTERNEAITTAKELITKFDIKQEEIF